ncbi:MAG: hypothetical protein HY650_07075 [Acidobacteria bacterium]|nr:hypothetical protein [Acidobacteriota bacterium]
MKGRTSQTVAGLGWGSLALAVGAIALTGIAHFGPAQTGSGLPPPTYDYDDSAPGIQGPTSPFLVGAEQRVYRSLLLRVPVLVPLAELQAMLPAGFTAVAAPAGVNAGVIQLNFFFQQINHRMANDGVVRGSGVAFHIPLLTNTHFTPPREEGAVLGYEASSQEMVDYLNEMDGPGCARLAKVGVLIREEGENLNLKFTVTDDVLGLNVACEATLPALGTRRVLFDPDIPLRVFPSNRSFFLAVQADDRTVPRAMANLQLEVPSGRIPVPNGAGGSRGLTVSSIGPNVSFRQNYEHFSKRE